MISLLLGIALAAPAAAPNPAAIDSSRQVLVACLKQAASNAKPGEVTLDGFAAYAKSHCANEEAALQDAMIRFDVKNGVSRKSAAEGAQMALDDYVETAKNNYAARTPN
jgi:hypothetical protein